jgi:hypothetical protein
MDWSDAKPIALVVPGDCQVDDEFWRMLAPHAIPFVSRTTGADERMSSDDLVVGHLTQIDRLAAGAAAGSGGWPPARFHRPAITAWSR